MLHWPWRQFARFMSTKIYYPQPSACASRKIDNISATKLIKNLYAKQSNGRVRDRESGQLIRDAFNIFHAIVGAKNEFSINTILTLCLRFDRDMDSSAMAHRLQSIWGDVEHLSRHADRIQHCYCLLLVCCMRWNDIPKFTQTLAWMEQHGHAFPPCNLDAMKVYKFLTSKSCVRQLRIADIQRIESLMRMAHHGHLHMPMHHTAYILAAVMKCYSAHNQLQCALDTFDSCGATALIYAGNNVMLNALLTVLMDHQHYSHAFDTYRRHQQQCTSHSLTHYLALKICVKLRDYASGCAVHAFLDSQRHSIPQDIKIQTQLIDFYGTFGEVDHACDVYRRIAVDALDVVCVGAMLKTLVNNGSVVRAIQIYDTLIIPKDVGCHVFAIKACAHLKDLRKGQSIFDAIESERQRSDVNVMVAMMDLYGQCGALASALDILRRVHTPQTPNLVAVNSMLTAYVHNARYKETLALYHDVYEMRKSVDKHVAHQTDLDIATVLAITACSKCGDVDTAKRLYAQHGHNPNVLIQTAFMDLMSHCFNDVENVLRIFDDIRARQQMNVVTINAAMTALIHLHEHEHALQIFDDRDELQRTSSSSRTNSQLRPNVTTFLMAIKACTHLQWLDKAKLIYDGIPSAMHTVQTHTAMIQVYGECGDLLNARYIFDDIIEDDAKTIVTVNCMLTALIQNESCDEAIELYDLLRLRLSDLRKDNTTYCLAIKACANGNRLEKGMAIHQELVRAKEQTRGTNDADYSHIHLIHMYAQRAMLAECEQLLDEYLQLQLVHRDHESRSSQDIVNVCNEMIGAYVRNDCLEKTEVLLHKMRNDFQVQPNEKTFSLLMNGCSHSGDVERAKRIWTEMDVDECIKYDTFFIGAMVDCHARKGLVYTAYEWVYRYEQYHQRVANTEQDIALWMSLMNGCRQQNNALFANYIYRQIKLRLQHDASCMHRADLLLRGVIKI